jgi:hypothetical protein
MRSGSKSSGGAVHGEAAGAVLDDPARPAAPQRHPVGGDRQHPERALGGLGGDEIAGQEGVREDDALRNGTGERPDLVLTRRGEDRQAVLGVRQVDLGEGPVEFPGHLHTPLTGDRRVVLQLLLGLGDGVAQPDGVAGVVRLAAVRRRQHRHGRVGAGAPEFGEGGGTQIVLHVSTIGRTGVSGIRSNSSHHSRSWDVSEPQELPSGGMEPYSRKSSTLRCTHSEDA